MAATAPDGFPEFQHVTLQRPQPGVLSLRWALRPHAWSMDDLAFTIFRSGGPQGPWTEVGSVPPGRFLYSDIGVANAPHGGTGGRVYYILRAASMGGRGYRDSGPMTLEHDADGIAFELVRKKNLYLTVRGGIGVSIFLRKAWGPKCSRCFNYQRMIPEDPDCLECYGTGFTGGYLDPLHVPALMNLPREAIVRAGIKYELGTTYAELSNWPLVDPDDLVVDRKMNIRYRIKTITPTSHKMHTVSQIVSVLRADENDVIYNLPVPELSQALVGHSWDLVDRERADPESPNPRVRPVL